MSAPSRSRNVGLAAVVVVGVLAAGAAALAVGGESPAPLTSPAASASGGSAPVEQTDKDAGKGGGAATLPPSSTPVVVHDCLHAVEQPTKMVLACGDAGFRARRLEWSQWKDHKARATGVFFVNDCDPGCAVGTYHRVLGRITLKDPQTCDGSGRVFTTGRVRLTEAVGGTRTHDVYPGCPPHP